MAGLLEMLFATAWAFSNIAALGIAILVAVVLGWAVKRS